MDTTRALARLILTAQHLPEPARTTALCELWTIRQLTPAGQREAVSRWMRCAQTWPSAS